MNILMLYFKPIALINKMEKLGSKTINCSKKSKKKIKKSNNKSNKFSNIRKKLTKT